MQQASFSQRITTLGHSRGGRLKLDDIRTEIRERFRGKWARNKLAEFDDFDACDRLF